MRHCLIDSTLRIHIDSAVYSEDVVFKCFYWYSKNFAVEISKDNNEHLVSLTPKSGTLHEVAVTELLDKIRQDLLDFKLRDIITKETKTVRELIIAKAFAYYEPEESPTTSASDPVGFNPET